MYTIASKFSSLALSIDRIFTFVFVFVDEVLISAKARYLLSFEILVSTAIVLDK